MTEEEKQEYEELKSLLYTGQISQYGKRKLIDIIEKQDTEINKLNNVIQNIREEFLKYDWENSTKEQICNQLKSLYESIFMKEDK